MPRRQLDNQIAIKERGGAPRYDQTAVRGARENRNGALDLLGVAHVDRIDVHLECWRRGRDGSKLAGSGALRSVPKNCHPRHSWRDLMSSRSDFPLRLYSNDMKPVHAAGLRAYQLTRHRPNRWQSGTRSARCGLPAAMALRSTPHVPG